MSIDTFMPSEGSRTPEMWDVINDLIKISQVDTNKITDGYHTFGELYEHRITLWVALLKVLFKNKEETAAWMTKKHSDGSLIEGWFLLGMGYDKGEQITYHLPITYWDYCTQNIEAMILEKAPEFDGHTSADVIERIKNIDYDKFY